MSNKVRNTSGKFAPKSETPRRIRSVNLTDDAWQWLAAVAEKAGVSRNDYLEALAENNNQFIETVQSKPIPLMETVRAELTPIMETVLNESQSLSQELEDAKADYVALLESSTAVANKLRDEVRKLRSQLADLEQNLAPASELPEAADLLNELKGKRKKSRADLADVEAILEMVGKPTGIPAIRN